MSLLDYINADTLKKREEPVTPVRVHALCECGGELVSTGNALSGSFTVFGHKCDKCGGEIDISGGSFPRIEYRTR